MVHFVAADLANVYCLNFDFQLAMTYFDLRCKADQVGLQGGSMCNAETWME